MARRQPNLTRLAHLTEPTIPTSQTTIRAKIPTLVPMTRDFPVYFGNNGGLAYFALQIAKTNSKEVFIRALASATASINNDKRNYTGSPLQIETLTGLDVISGAAPADYGNVLKTNFFDAEDVTIGEVVDLLSSDVDEIAFYIGVICLAGVKRLTDQNKAAFYDNRLNAVRAACHGTLKIFTPNSPFLVDNVLNLAYASFVSFGIERSYIMYNCAVKAQGLKSQLQSAFYTMFLLLVDQGMTALKIIREATSKYPELIDEFPEIWNELYAVNDALDVLNKMNAVERPFVKSIYGSAFVPLPYQETANLLGICGEVMREITPSYKNYAGGKISDTQSERVRKIMGLNAQEGLDMHVHGDNTTRMGVPGNAVAQ